MIWFLCADMAELADAHGSGPCEHKFLQVQVLLSAPVRITIRDLVFVWLSFYQRMYCFMRYVLLFFDQNFLLGFDVLVFLYVGNSNITYNLVVNLFKISILKVFLKCDLIKKHLTFRLNCYII